MCIYNIKYGKVSFDYVQYEGASDVLSALANNQIDVGVTAIPFTSSQISTRPDLISLPLVAISVVPTYNIDGFANNPPLVFSCQLIANITLGFIDNVSRQNTHNIHIYIICIYMFQYIFLYISLFI
jgi:ABC-type phosphate transport system substrate-binding protein